MLGVDRSWFVETCPDCDHSADVFEVRLFTIPLHTERTVEPGIKERVATDLGVPCQHPHLDRWHKHRYWGLLWCAAPCINGIDRLQREDWYDMRASTRVRQLAAGDPTVPERFRNQVLNGHNPEFWWDFRAMVAPPSHPPN
jgi:hypothetical protein